MKKLFFITALALFATTTIFAATVQDLPEFDFGQYFTSFSAYVLAVLPLTGWIKQALGWQDQKAKLLSWVVGIALPFAAWYFKLGVFADFTEIWHVAATGVLGAFAANGVFKTVIAQAILKIIKAQ